MIQAVNCTARSRDTFGITLKIVVVGTSRERVEFEYAVTLALETFRVILTGEKMSRNRDEKM